MLPVVVEEQGLRASLAFVITRPRPDRVDVAPVALGLGMHGRIAIDLGGGGLEDLAAQALGQAQHVDRAVHAGLGRGDGVVLVMDRRGRAGEVVDLVDLDIERKGHVMAHELEPGMVVQVLDVALGAGKEVVGADHLMPLFKQAVGQVRAEETGAAGDQDAFAGVVKAGHGKSAPWGFGNR